MDMSDESKVTREDIMEQMQAGHRARIDGTTLQNLNKDSVQFHEVMPNRGQYQQPIQPQAAKQPQQEQNMPESYLNYAAQLLEQMRGVYASSWENCECGSSPAWHGGHNHFYDPCSGAANPPVSSCPVYDCNSNTCCNDNFYAAKPPRPPHHPMQDCGTTTFYDDCAYKLQKMSDQLTRIETMTQDMYAVNQQLATYIIEYYNKFISSQTTSGNNNC